MTRRDVLKAALAALAAPVIPASRMLPGPVWTPDLVNAANFGFCIPAGAMILQVVRAWPGPDGKIEVLYEARASINQASDSGQGCGVAWNHPDDRNRP